MTILAIGVLLALGMFVFCLAAFRSSRKSWEAIAAALVLGLAGLTRFGGISPPSAPKEAEQLASGSGESLVSSRLKLGNLGPMARDRWVVTSDALARNGQFAEAAGMALGAIEADPKNADAWLAIANNLVAHAQGNLTPAAAYAYRKAIEAGPDQPGPVFFLGLALAQRGEFEKARELWESALAKAPADAGWRAPLQARLDELNSVLARQQIEEKKR